MQQPDIKHNLQKLNLQKHNFFLSYNLCTPQKSGIFLKMKSIFAIRYSDMKLLKQYIALMNIYSAPHYNQFYRTKKNCDTKTNKY